MPASAFAYLVLLGIRSFPSPPYANIHSNAHRVREDVPVWRIWYPNDFLAITPWGLISAPLFLGVSVRGPAHTIGACLMNFPDSTSPYNDGDVARRPVLITVSLELSAAVSPSSDSSHRVLLINCSLNAWQALHDFSGVIAY